jgi:hypothetical protein
VAIIKARNKSCNYNQYKERTLPLKDGLGSMDHLVNIVDLVVFNKSKT